MGAEVVNPPRCEGQAGAASGDSAAASTRARGRCHCVADHHLGRPPKLAVILCAAMYLPTGPSIFDVCFDAGEGGSSISSEVVQCHIKYCGCYSLVILMFPVMDGSYLQL